MVSDLGFRIKGLGFRVQGLGFRVQDSKPRLPKHFPYNRFLGLVF